MARWPESWQSLPGIFGASSRNRLGFAKFYVWQNAAGLFMQEKQVQTALGTVGGLLADLAMGAILGVLFVLYLKLSRDKNIILKGWGFGMGLWLFLFGIVMHSLPSAKVIAPKDAASAISDFIGHSIFGLILGLLASWFLRATNTNIMRED